MKVSEAKQLIQNLSNKVQDVEALGKLSEKEWDQLAQKVGINSTRDGFIAVCVNALLFERNILKERIEDAELNI